MCLLLRQGKGCMGLCTCVCVCLCLRVVWWGYQERGVWLLVLPTATTTSQRATFYMADMAATSGHVVWMGFCFVLCSLVVVL